MCSESQVDKFAGEVLSVEFTISDEMARMLISTFGIDKPLDGVTKFSIEYSGRTAYLVALNNNYFCLWSYELPELEESSCYNGYQEESFEEVSHNTEAIKKFRYRLYFCALLISLVVIAVTVYVCILV